MIEVARNERERKAIAAAHAERGQAVVGFFSWMFGGKRR